MQAIVDRLVTELRGAWRFRRHALVTAWGVCLLGWLIVFAIPDVYEAHARVNVDTRTPLRTVVQGLAVENDVESQLNAVRQALLGRPNLEKVAQKVGLDQSVTTPAEKDELLRELGSRIDISLEPTLNRDPRIPNTFYRISYTDNDRQVAFGVVDVLLNTFVESTMGAERTGTKSAQQFLRDQLHEYDARLAEAEERLAAFKKKNVGLVPGPNQGDFFSRLQAEIQEIKRLQGLIRVADNRRMELERQLRGETPFVPALSAATSGQGTEGPQTTAARIQETQARLDDMLLRFTDKHPDVVAAREALKELRERQAQELEALKRGDPAVAAIARANANPVYQNIQLQLNQTEVELATLRGQLSDHMKTEAELRKMASTVPEVEAEYARLTRDYDVTRAQYNSLLERLEQAKLSTDAEATGVVRFDIVDPTAASFHPIFPNRPLFLFAVLVVGLGAGGGIAWLLHQFKPVFVDSRSLSELTGLPVLGSISRTWLEEQQRKFRFGLVRYALASGLLFVVFIVAVAAQQPAARFMRELWG